MSIRIMAQVFESDLPPTERFVLVVLADHADDEGVCYPSVSRICKRTGFSERTVRGALRRLEASGRVVVALSAGRHGANLYRINPAGDAPRQEMPPGRRCTTPLQEMPVPPAGDAPEPSITINEPSIGDCGEFDAFWGSWPNKVGKAAAQKAWKKLAPEERMLAREKATAWFSAWRAKHKDASPIHPATYLNGRRWQDGGTDPPAQIDRATFWAESIRAGRYVSQAVVPPAVVAEIRRRALVPDETLRKRGLL